MPDLSNKLIHFSAVLDSCERIKNRECTSPIPVNSIPFVTTKSLVRQSHLSECDARLNADRTPTIKLRKGGTRDTSLRSERRNSLDLCCRMSHPSRGRTVMYQKGESADCKVMLRGYVEGSRNLALPSRGRSEQVKGHKLRHGAVSQR